MKRNNAKNKSLKRGLVLPLMLVLSGCIDGATGELMESTPSRTEPGDRDRAPGLDADFGGTPTVDGELETCTGVSVERGAQVKSGLSSLDADSANQDCVGHGELRRCLDLNEEVGSDDLRGSMSGGEVAASGNKDYAAMRGNLTSTSRSFLSSSPVRSKPGVSARRVQELSRTLDELKIRNTDLKDLGDRDFSSARSKRKAVLRGGVIVVKSDNDRVQYLSARTQSSAISRDETVILDGEGDDHTKMALFGHHLDLSNMEIVIMPWVKKFIVVADSVDFTNSVITWKPKQPGPRPEIVPGIARSPRSDYDPFHVRGNPDHYRAPSGGDGADGKMGHRGTAGPDAPNVSIFVRSLLGHPKIDLPGTDGGAGGPGQYGQKGGDGAKGRKAHWNFFTGCSTRGVGWGGHGGDGGRGGDGGQGGRGGRGGNVDFFLVSFESIQGAEFRSRLSGGQGGKGGGFGMGGHPGFGGMQGNKPGWCFFTFDPRRDGKWGKMGQTGNVGKHGEPGRWGYLMFHEIDEHSFNSIMRSPIVAGVSPKIPRVTEPSLLLSVENVGDVEAVHVRIEDAMGSTHETLCHSVDEKRCEIDLSQVADLSSGVAEISALQEETGQWSQATQLALKPVATGPGGVFSSGELCEIPGKGFHEDSMIYVDGHEVEAVEESDENGLIFRLPRPNRPFSTSGEPALVEIVTPGLPQPVAVEVPLRRSIDTGFHHGENAFSFANTKALGVLPLDELQLAYEESFSTLWSPWGWILYSQFFHKQPGSSSGFSALAMHRYIQGRSPLASIYPNEDAARFDITKYMGRTLGQHALSRSHAQSVGWKNASERTLSATTESFTDLQQGLSVENAIIYQLIPKGGVLHKGMLDRLNKAHGLLPIRLEYPGEGDDWYRRVYVYENHNDDEEYYDLGSFFEFGGNGDPKHQWTYYGRDQKLSEKFQEKDGWVLASQPLSAFTEPTAEPYDPAGILLAVPQD